MAFFGVTTLQMRYQSLMERCSTSALPHHRHRKPEGTEDMNVRQQWWGAEAVSATMDFSPEIASTVVESSATQDDKADGTGRHTSPAKKRAKAQGLRTDRLGPYVDNLAFVEARLDRLSPDFAGEKAISAKPPKEFEDWWLDFFARRRDSMSYWGASHWRFWVPNWKKCVPAAGYPNMELSQ